MSWNYRVIETSRPGGKIYTIHECYYDGDIPDQQEMDPTRRPNSICEDQHQPLGLMPEELRRDVKRMFTAFEREIVDRGEYHVKIRYERKKKKSVAVDLTRQLKEAKEELREWKRNFLKANTRRVVFMQRVEELEKKLASRQAAEITA